MKKLKFQATILAVSFRMDDSDLLLGRIPGSSALAQDIAEERAFLRDIAQVPSGANQHPENRTAKIVEVREIWSKYTYHGHGPDSSLFDSSAKAVKYILSKYPIEGPVLIKQAGRFRWNLDQHQPTPTRPQP